MDASTAAPVRQHRRAGQVTLRSVDRLDRFIMHNRMVMREYPADALGYRNSLYAIGLDLFEAATSNRQREKVQAALDAIDQAFKRHIETYREPASGRQEAA